jgi:hypothetical protein
MKKLQVSPGLQKPTNQIDEIKIQNATSDRVLGTIGEFIETFPVGHMESGKKAEGGS